MEDKFSVFYQMEKNGTWYCWGIYKNFGTARNTANKLNQENGFSTKVMSRGVLHLVNHA